MTTASFSSVIDHTSDAGFRAWGQGVSTALTAVGLTQAADTGQIDLTTVTRPGTTTAAGYQIWRFNDTLQGSAPIFIKLEYGTSNIATVPALWVTVATGSNGSGTLTGTTLLARTMTGLTNSAPASTVTAYPSYFCYSTTLSFLGWALKNGYNANGTFSVFMLGRSCDATGTPTGTGVTMFVGNSNSGNSHIQTCTTYATGTKTINSISGKYSLIPGGVTSSSSGSDIQAFLNWAMYPLVEPINWRCTVIQTEITAGLAFQLRSLVRRHTRTYH